MSRRHAQRCRRDPCSLPGEPQSKLVVSDGKSSECPPPAMSLPRGGKMDPHACTQRPRSRVPLGMLLATNSAARSAPPNLHSQINKPIALMWGVSKSDEAPLKADMCQKGETSCHTIGREGDKQQGFYFDPGLTFCICSFSPTSSQDTGRSRVGASLNASSEWLSTWPGTTCQC